MDSESNHLGWAPESAFLACSQVRQQGSGTTLPITRNLTNQTSESAKQKATRCQVLSTSPNPSSFSPTHFHNTSLFLFLTHTKPFPASGSWHLLSPLPGMPFLQLFPWLAASPHSYLTSNFTSSARPSLTDLSNLVYILHPKTIYHNFFFLSPYQQKIFSFFNLLFSPLNLLSKRKFYESWDIVDNPQPIIGT